MIQVFADDPDYSSMSGWAAYADAGVLQAINDGMRVAQGWRAIGSGGIHGGAAWALFFQSLTNRRIDNSTRIILRLAGEQGGVNYATSLAETQRRYEALTDRVAFKSAMFLIGANGYRGYGMMCHVDCSNPFNATSYLFEALVVAHTDPRTSGDTWLIQSLAKAPEFFSRLLFGATP